MTTESGSPSFSSLLSSNAPVLISSTSSASSSAATMSSNSFSEVKLDTTLEVKQALTSQSAASERAAHQIHSFDGIDDMPHPDEQEDEHAKPVPKKQLALAILLFVIGIGCLSAGIDHLVGDKPGGFALLLVGIIVLIPSCYQLYLIWGHCRRKPGFSLSDLPEM